MERILINDSKTIKDLKNLEDKERAVIYDVINKTPGANNIDELIAVLTTQCLIPICNDHSTSEYSVGYKLGINAAAILSSIYMHLAPSKFFLIKRTDYILHIKSPNQDSEIDELKKTVIILDSLLQEIADLLLCDGFLHTINIIQGEETNAPFAKKLYLKQYSTTIPNPHDIPNAYDVILHNNKKEIYKIYTNFLHFFAGNWDIAIKKLGKIKKSLNELHKLCPLERLSLAQETCSVMGLTDLNVMPEDIKKSLLQLSPEQLLFFHSFFIKEKLHSDYFDIITVDGKVISKTLQKIAETLTDPLKNVVHFNIILEMMVRCMVQLRRMQTNNLSDSQQHMMQHLQKILDSIYNKRTIPVKEVYAMAQEIAKPFLSEIEKIQSQQNIVENMKKSGGNTMGMM